MPRNMSFALTTEQFKNKTKDVTRRLGWGFLEGGELLWGVKKGMGLQKGEKVERLGLIEVVSAEPEPLDSITQGDVAREGFLEWTPERFVGFFCRENKIAPDTIVNRIEFKHIGELLTQELINECPPSLHIFLAGCEIGDLVFKASDLWFNRDLIGDFPIGERGLEAVLAEAFLPDSWPEHQEALEYIKAIK